MRHPARYVVTTCVVVLLVTGLGCGGCGRPEEEKRWETAQKTKGPAVAREALPGSAFNKFFPKGEGDFSVVFTQEKQGTSVAKLEKGGKELAQLSIFDTVSNPEAAEEYKTSTESFDAYPLKRVGKNGTNILVADRFQVAIRSLDESFGEFDRDDWLKKFDLAGLAKLK